jgi:hypothetical protein
VIILLLAAGGAVAQDKGTLKPHALPPLANPDDPKTPAKELFGMAPAQPHNLPGLAVDGKRDSTGKTTTRIDPTTCGCCAVGATCGRTAPCRLGIVGISERGQRVGLQRALSARRISLSAEQQDDQYEAQGQVRRAFSCPGLEGLRQTFGPARGDIVRSVRAIRRQNSDKTTDFPADGCLAA